MPIIGFNDVIEGQTTKESDIDYGLVPIGIPIPWHKSLIARSQTTLKAGNATAYGANKLVDAGGGFTGVVSVGDIIWNSTDSVFATVTAIDSDTQLALDWDAFDTGNEGYSIYDEPELPESWLECDGSVIADADSLLDGLTIPDLNGEGRFIRGGSTAGIDQADAFQGHRMQILKAGGTHLQMGANIAAGGFNGLRSIGGTTVFMQDIITDGVHGVPRTASETRSINMSTIMIMRIK